MKSLITSFLLIGLTYSLLADILPGPPEGQKIIGYCVKIQNADSFPDVAFVISVSWPVPPFTASYTELNSKDCLSNRHDFPHAIYALNKTYLNLKGINKINYSQNALMTNISVPAISYQFVPDDSPVKSISELYRVLGFNNSSTIIYLSKRITVYNDDHQDSILFTVPAGFDNLKSTIAINTTGVKNEEKFSQLLIYPTPSQEYLNLYKIDNNLGNVSVEFFDMAGRKLSIYNFMKNQEELKITMDIRSLHSGIYNLRYSVGNYIENRLFLKK
jgi:hypothetical protein